MKKITSLLMAVLLLATMLTVFAVPTFAEGDTTVMTETGTCHVELKKGINTYIEFTPSSEGNYTFISNAIKVSTGYPKLTANLYYKTRKIASDMAFSAGNGNFRITYLLEAGKTYKLEIQLNNPASCFADVSVFEEVIPESICEISGKCIISNPGTYECDYFIVKEGSSVIIGENTTVKVKQGLANSGKIELLGKLDSYQAYAFQPGDINIGKNGSLVESKIKSSGYDIITWHKNGGTLTRQGALISSLQGDTYETYYTPGIETELYFEAKKPGYGFVGWYNNPDFTGEPVTKIGANETGNKEFWAKYCNHSGMTQKKIESDIKDKYEEGYYYFCENCGNCYNDADGESFLANKNDIASLLSDWCERHITAYYYIDASLDNSDNVKLTGKYIDAKNVKAVTANDTSWGAKDADTWYVCSGSVTVNGRININGKVHLILRDGCTLTAKNGVNLAEGNTLSVYGQSDGENRGKLIATGDDGKAAIGGNGSLGSGFDINAENAGTLNVFSGEIRAEGKYSVGIGGGFGAYGVDGDDINNDRRSGGDLGIRHTTSGKRGGNGGFINIYSGFVTATGKIGIGGGFGGDGGRSESLLDYVHKTVRIIRVGNGGDGGDGSTLCIFGGVLNVEGDYVAFSCGYGGSGGQNRPVPYGFTVVEKCADSRGGKFGGDGKLTVKGGTVMLYGIDKAAGNTEFDLENCVLKAGASAETATPLNDVSEYTNQKYLSAQCNGGVSALGLILSNGNLWIIIAIAVVALGTVAAIVIVKKKKKPALASGTENTDEE